jgi:predicted DNA-binding protein (MmcQ/YjbR family)
MKYDALEKRLMLLKGAEKDFPFGDDAAVFKVLGKMFALIAWNDEPLRITLKCDPAEADLLRSTFEAIKPGYYMNKNHWNTITIDASISEEMLFDMIDTSYSLVAKGLKKTDREKLENL